MTDKVTSVHKLQLLKRKERVEAEWNRTEVWPELTSLSKAFTAGPTTLADENNKHGAQRPQKPLGLLGTGRRGDMVSLFSPPLHTPHPPLLPFSPSLISRMVSVDVKQHVHLCSVQLVRALRPVKTEETVIHSKHGA